MKNIIKDNKLTILFIFLLLSFSLFFLLFYIDGLDYFWHVKIGEEIINKGTILRSDIFSWYVRGKSFISHEWLFDVSLYLFKNTYIYTFTCLSILFLILFFSNKKEYLKNIPFSLFWISLGLIFIPFIKCRPYLFSYIFIVLCIYILYDLYNNEKSNKYFFLPIIGVFWTNIHGGSSNLLYIFCFIFLFSGLFNFCFSKIESKKISKLQIKKYLFSILLIVFSLCINPYGFKMLSYPYINIADSTMINNISEWQPTNLNILAHYPYLFLAFVIIIIFVFSNKKVRLIDFLLFGFMFLLGLKSIRFWPYVYIVSTYFIFYYIDKRNIDKYTDIIIFLVSLALIISFIGNFRISNYEILNNNIITFLKKEKPKRLFNYYDYGGYLIYNDIDVFIDGRADLYSRYNYKDYLIISNLDYNYVEKINKYNFDYFVIPKKIGLTSYLEGSNDYELVYKNEKTVVYKIKRNVAK